MALAALLAASVPAAANADRTANGFAIAVNRGHVGYVVVAGRKSGDAAAKEALRLCRKAAGSSCETLVAARADYLAIGYGADGSLMFSTDASTPEAVAALAANCRKSFGRACMAESTFNLAIRSELVTPLLPRRFAAIAVAASAAESAKNGRNDADPRFWVASGLASADQAISRAMTDCAAALGQNACRFFVTSGQTHIAIYRNEAGTSGGFRINLSAQAALGDIDAECRAAGEKCQIVGLQAASEDAVRAYDLQNMRGVPLG